MDPTTYCARFYAVTAVFDEGRDKCVIWHCVIGLSNSFFLRYFALNIKSQLAFETSGATYLPTRRHIPEEPNHQKVFFIKIHVSWNKTACRLVNVR